MLFVALPRTTGANVLGCNPHFSDGRFSPSAMHPPPHAPLKMASGGAVFIILLIITAVLAYKSYRPLKRAMRLQPGTPDQRRETAGYFAQYRCWSGAHSSFSLSTPAVHQQDWILGFDALPHQCPHRTPIGSLAHLARGYKHQAKRLVNGVKALRVALLLVVFLSFTLGWVQTLNFIPAAQDAERREADLIYSLLNRGITHIYTDYWTCDRIAFESRERIICSVVDEQLQPGVNRYTPYTAIVNADFRCLLIPLGSPQARDSSKTCKNRGRPTHHSREMGM